MNKRIEQIPMKVHFYLNTIEYHYEFHMMSLNLCFSSSLPNMVSIAPPARSQISFLLSPKCSAISEYSFERVLPNTPTSSV